MATAAMALSVYKRFQAFPCIVQNNPLLFSRKADPKVGTQGKVTSAPQQSSEVSDPPPRVDSGPLENLLDAPSLRVRQQSNARLMAFVFRTRFGTVTWRRDKIEMMVLK